MEAAGEMVEARRTTRPDGPADGLPPLVEAMLRPEFYPESPAQVEFKQTHISYVFIAGDFVYKVKKPVHFAFLNYSNLAERLHYCREEVRLNKRLSPRVYLGVFAILKRADSFVLGPEVHADHPEAVEYAVKMRRLPENRMLDALLAAGQVDRDTIRAIAARIAEFHASAPSNRGWTYGSAAAI
jgi:aminoglycoside phosphotransferase family enzyme